MELEKLIQLVDAVSQSNLSGFEYEENDIKLHLFKKEENVGKEFVKPVQVKETVIEAPAGNIVESPLVGTFYAAPSEDAEAFVKVGDLVKKGQTLAIIEAMKLMNEIESECDGKITEIFVENNEAVEFGQPLFRIEKG